MVSNHDQEPELSESLVGLVGAFDRLKADMGLESGAESMLQIESYVSGVRDENEELRQHAEDAITMAQKYKAAYEELAEENAGLYEQLTQAKISDMVSHAQDLSAVAYEYDKEVVMTKVAQAEEMVAHAYAIQERLDELEEENEALKQTLHEIREDQKQMHALRELDASALREGCLGGAADGMPDVDVECGSPVVGSPRSATDEGRKTPESGERDNENVSNGSPIQYATPGSVALSNVTVTPAKNQPNNNDPLVLADALAAVAKGSESGMVASASKMLRNYHDAQAELEELRARNDTLAKENAELTEMMTSKQFKAPSAWAEREVKHKLEQKEWEELARTKDTAIKELETEIASLRTAQGTAGLQERIVDLEAQLVRSRRECADVKASLHEMQVASMVSVGEFSVAGVTPLGGNDDVHSIVDRIESESDSSAVSGMHIGLSVDVKRQRQLEEELENLQLEKADILGNLEAIQANIARSKVAAAESEIALLENGISVEMAAKILQIERDAADDTLNETVEEDETRETSTLAMIEVADAIREARRAVLVKGDCAALQLIDGLQVASCIQGLGAGKEAAGAGENGAEAESTDIQDVTNIVESDRQKDEVTPISDDAMRRIEQLKTDIEELKFADKPINPVGAGQEASAEICNENAPVSGMQPRAAAALAAVNRAQERDIERLKQQLEDASKRETNLKQKLSETAVAASSPSPLSKQPPIRLNLNILGTPGKQTGATSTASSTITPMLSPGGLALARKDADQAWEEHQKKTDVSAILREKATIEARLDLTKSQLTKSQQALDAARHDVVAMKKAIKQAIATGDVKSVQKALEETSKSSSAIGKASSPLKRLKGRGIFSLKKSSSSSKESSRPGSGESAEAIPNVRLKTLTGTTPVTTPGHDKLDGFVVNATEVADVTDGAEGLSRASREIENLTDENEMLMDQLVSTKVRLAEVEGEVLQSRRALVRAKEKNMAISKQLKDIRAGPLERG